MTEKPKSDPLTGGAIAAGALAAGALAVAYCAGLPIAAGRSPRSAGSRLAPLPHPRSSCSSAASH